jgi:FPC/CPF motif-containing protein YcgG
MTEQQPRKITPLTFERFELEKINYEEDGEKYLPIWKDWKTWEELRQKLLEYGNTEWESKKTVAAIRYLFPDWETKTEEERIPDYEELFAHYPLGVALHRSEKVRKARKTLLPVFD